MSPVSCSVLLEDSSDAVMDWSRAVTVPAAVLGVPPVPPAFPIPTTACPTETVLEFPNGATLRPEAFCSCITATSLVRL